jgi:hypothetical protein
MPRRLLQARPTWARRLTSGALAAAALALSTSACHGPSLPVGLSTCYQSIPLAEGALHAAKGSYRFQGVKLVDPKIMEHLVKRRYPHVVPPQVRLAPHSKACAFAFTGNFKAGQVSGASPTAKGKAAILLFTTDRRALFGFVIAGLPERFSRTFTRP